jgi:endonuclease/exonuclease/phosphatase family metal-dependent hydrolase
MKLSRVLSFLSWLAVLALWGCAASVYVSPAHFRYAAPLGLLFPFFVAAVLATGAVSLVLRPRLVWISLAGLAGCCGTLRDYFPVNLSSPPPKGAVTALTYNTMSCAMWQKEDGTLVVPRFVCEAGADVACLQEVMYRNEGDSVDVRRLVSRYGYHYASARLGNNRLVLLSRRPVVGQETVCRRGLNGAVAFRVLLRPRDTLTVVNAHLTTMALSAADRRRYHELIRNPEGADTIHGKLDIVRKIARAGEMRACLADTLAAFVRREGGRKMLLMGDFNDTPVSYTHHLVCSLLTDAFRATGNGVGRSFNRDGIYVRIDNIFCSRHFKPYACTVRDDVPYSDHYPVTCCLKPQ